MDEILALQAALATAQDTKSSIRLSERNIVELVNKLKSLDLLDDTLLYTLNGKEYLTEARLDAEIKREVKRSGGRVPVTDLQPALNVDVAHCERRARALAADAASNGVALVEGGLSRRRTSTPSPPRRTRLREAGVIGVGELARRHGLSADLMTRRCASASEAGAVDGRLEGGSVYTPGYVRRLARAAAGARRAALVPTTRDALVANALRREDRHGVADAALTGALLGTSREGVPEGAPGSAGKRGGRNEPADTENVPPTARSAAAPVTSRCTSARRRLRWARCTRAPAWSLRSRRRAWEWPDPSSYFGGDGCKKSRRAALGESRRRAARVVEQLDAAVRDALAENGGWCECGALVPPDLPPADAPALLAATDAVGGADEKGAGERRRSTKRQDRRSIGGEEKREENASHRRRRVSGSVLRRSAERRRTGRASRRATHHAQQIASRASRRARRLRDAWRFERARARARARGRTRARGGHAEAACYGPRRARGRRRGEADRAFVRGEAADESSVAESSRATPARSPEASAFVVRAEDLDSDDDASRGGKGKKGKGKGKKGGGGVLPATAPSLSARKEKKTNQKRDAF